VIGQFLVPGLIAAGHEVTASTRSPLKANRLEGQGARPAVVDGLHREAVLKVVTAAGPDVIVHQMTALTHMKSFGHLDRQFAVTNELRSRQVAEGLVLRDGVFHGHGASDVMLEVLRKRQMPVIDGGTGVWSFTEVTDAAAATAAAVAKGAAGIYNVVDDEPAPVSRWVPYLASCLGAKPPMHAPAWLGRLLGGEMIVEWMTQGRGASNERAKRELGWTPKHPSWRDGFPVWVEEFKSGKAA
jgi:nucleoside-diphosphate-sugar epimerase